MQITCNMMLHCIAQAHATKTVTITASDLRQKLNNKTVEGRTRLAHFRSYRTEGI